MPLDSLAYDLGKNRNGILAFLYDGKLTGLADPLVRMLQKQGKFRKRAVGKALLEHSGRFRSDLLQLRISRSKHLDGTVLIDGPTTSVIGEIKVAVVAVLHIGCRQALHDGFDFGNLKTRAGRR